jgi:hypothetical protein
VAKIKDNVVQSVKNVREIIRDTNLKKLLLSKGMLSPGEAAIAAVAYKFQISEITLGMELRSTIAKMPLIPRIKDVDTAQSAAAKTAPLFSKMKGLFYAITAILAMIGAFQVYRKVQLGEDIGKSIAIWSFSVLLIFILMQIAELMIGS